MSSFRRHNEEFPPGIKDQVFDLSMAVYATLKPIRQVKAPLRLARDLAFSKRSLFPPEINDDIPTPCDVVHQAYNTPAAQPWFLSKIPQPRPTPRWHAHRQTDPSASDFLVGLNRQRRRDDPASGRGKAKRTMTALTTDSEPGSDTPHGTYEGYRHIRQVSPRFYHALDPNDGTEPPFPPRIARNRHFSPLPTQRLLIETTTNATLTAVNQHLMSAGLLPRRTVDPQPTEPSLTRTASHPSTLVQKQRLPRSLPITYSA